MNEPACCLHEPIAFKLQRLPWLLCCALAWLSAVQGLRADMGDPKGTVQAPVIVYQPLGRTVTAGGFMAFAVSNTEAATVTYRWLKNGQPLSDGNSLSGTTNAVLTIYPVQTTNAGSYSVAITNAGGGVVSDSATLTVVPFTVGYSPTDGGYLVTASTQRGDISRMEVTVNYGVSWQIVGYVTNRDGTAQIFDSIPGSPRFYRAAFVRSLPMLARLPWQSGQPVRVAAYGWPGDTNRVEACPALGQWETVATVTNRSGWVDVMDANASGQPIRFHRVIAP